MKYSEITFQSIITAFRHRWKTVLISVLVFSVIGICAGLFYADRLSTPAAGTADSIQTVDFTSVPYNKDYYTACRNALNSAYNNAQSYLSALMTGVPASGPQDGQLKALKSELDTFNAEHLTPIQAAFSKLNALYIPAEFRDEKIAEYENLLETTRRNMLSAEIAVDLIKSMQIPTTTTETFTKTYENLLAQAANYGTYKRNMEINQQMLDRLDNDFSAIMAETRALEADLEAAAGALNEIIAAINDTAAQVASETFINIQVTYEANGSIQTGITHTHSQRSDQDVFLILTIFCVLVGVCSGAFFAICREAFAAKKQSAA